MPSRSTEYHPILMKRLRQQEERGTPRVRLHSPRLSAPLTPQPHCTEQQHRWHRGTLSPSHRAPQSPQLSHHALPALSCSCSSASDFIWIPENADYVTARFQAPALLAGLSEVWVLPEKTQQLGSCICSYSAAQTPRGRHPRHEYIQDIWVNKNASSTEPNVNQPLSKSTEIKYLPVLRELTQAYTLLDPKQHLSRTQDARCSCTTLWEKLVSWPADKNMPFLPCLLFVSWRKTTQIKMPELRHYQEIQKTRQSLVNILLTVFTPFVIKAKY